MERVLSPEEKLRIAEERYYKKQGVSTKEISKKSDTPKFNRKYLLKKMIIQILICFFIYCSYYVIKNFNFIFSKEVIDKTNEILSYDVNIQELYCKVANYINNYSYFKQKDEENKQREEEINQTEDTNNEITNEDTTENNIDESNIETVSDATEVEETVPVANALTQMQIDANDIKENYSLINPLVGQITSRFGARTQTENVVSPYHVGLDIAANTGTAIIASMEGTVVVSGEIGGYGKCVQIQKDEILTIYGHCNNLYVNNGDVVAQGQKIAEVGQTGNATGPHLHFEIRKSGRYVDPELIFTL